MFHQPETPPKAISTHPETPPKDSGLVRFLAGAPSRLQSICSGYYYKGAEHENLLYEMKHAQKIFAFCILISSFLPVVANAQTVEDLFGLCRSPLHEARGACLGYVSATFDSMVLNGAELANVPVSDKEAYSWLSETSICPPDDEPQPSKDALVQVFENWATENPKYWGVDEHIGVALALQSAWPCSGS